jgi:RNA polymerase sigma factor (sigma-70 family)
MANLINRLVKQPEDQVYIDKVKHGDSASYAFLVDRYKHMAYTIALRILRNAEDAEDAAQEGFVKAYQQLHRFEGKSKFSTWLYTIVYRVAITKVEQQRMTTVSIHEENAETFMDHGQRSQLEHLQVTEQQNYIKDAISRLSGIDGLLITLYYLDEKSIREIEEITSLSESNIKVKLFRARKVLEEQLRFLL